MALLGLSGSEVLALSLGRITVQSSLGEPLRAEIEVPDINAEEAASLRANVASPDAFVAAGLEYNAAMPGLRARLVRRADGRSVLSLTSERPINDPFVDMILEASWSSGRIVRDYTMLFDPPSLKAATQSPTLPQTSGSSSQAPKVSAPAKASAPASAVSVDTPPVSATTKKAAAAQASTPGKLEAQGTEQVTVKLGDSASKIASRAKASDVSLDQMLVALMRANPDAFARGNINRLRAGAVLDIPSAEQAKSVAAAEATQMVVAQSKDFNEFRRNLAANAPQAAVETADRKSGGKLDATVDDKKPSGATPDKLTLSKGALQAKANEAKIAKERADKDAAERAAEISKNIAELGKLGAASSAAGSTPAKPSSAPAIAVATAPIAAASATSPAPAPAPAASKPNPATSAPAKPAAVAAPMPVEELGILDELLADPLVPAGGAGLLALLVGAGFYLQRKRKQKSAHVDSSFLESRLQPDSFFGASGGQRVDTGNEGASSASSMVYSPSQLDAADDVDPVAEADVYLAYGRDLQAEEILKEAVRHNPGRLAIHTKLLEIFAKRRDVASFQSSATQAFKLSGIDTPEWARVCELGLSIDPENPLYQPGAATLSAFGSLEPVPEPAAYSGNSTVAMSAQGQLPDPNGNIDLDLDLDFSADEPPASAISDVTGGTFNTSAPEQTVKMAAQPASDDNGLDFNISGPGEIPASTSLPDISMSLDSLELDEPGSLDMPDFQSTGTMPAEPVAETQTTKLDDGMLEFDLGSLSLDLDPPESIGASSTMGEDPLETKLALADEFVSIGDSDGARALIEEVVAEASGELRAKAERALANLS